MVTFLKLFINTIIKNMEIKIFLISLKFQNIYNLINVLTKNV
jgi:hypothetical protein